MEVVQVCISVWLLATTLSLCIVYSCAILCPPTFLHEFMCRYICGCVWLCVANKKSVWIMGRRRALVYWYSGSLPGRLFLCLPGGEPEGGGGWRKRNQRWAVLVSGMWDKWAEWGTIKFTGRQFVLRTKDKIEVRAGTKGHTDSRKT